MLVALLLPAVNAARENGRQVTCKNNLKNLYVAITGHVNSIGSFPSGGWGNNWVGVPEQGSGPGQPGGWIYQILPYMDNNALHDLGKGSLSPSTSASAKRVSTPLATLYCPTRRASQAYPISATYKFTDPVSVAGRTDYAANGGSFRIAITSSNTPTNLPAPANTTWPDLTNFNGIVAVHSNVTTGGVPDNKDTCYLVGEKYMSPENYFTGVDQTGVPDLGDTHSALSGDDLSTIRWSCQNCPTGATSFSGYTILPPAQDRVPSGSSPRPPNCSQLFGSSHSAGWCVVFVGGNAQLISWGLNPTMHIQMSTRNGHEVVDASQIP
jgi:hypothetical protein